MPQKAATTQKETRLSIRASEPEKNILMQAARARHTNISQFVLQVSLAAAHAVLVDQSEFRLPPEQWKACCERLDAPAKVIPALRQLFSEPEPVRGYPKTPFDKLPTYRRDAEAVSIEGRRQAGSLVITPIFFPERHFLFVA